MMRVGWTRVMREHLVVVARSSCLFVIWLALSSFVAATLCVRNDVQPVAIEEGIPGLLSFTFSLSLSLVECM
jgi:hypothetical protein